jgi:hypothetical protein
METAFPYDLEMRKQMGKVILSTGVLPYVTLSMHVLTLKRCTEMYAPEQFSKENE